MASSIGAGRTRTALWALLGVLILVGVIDGGSCAIARAQVDEDAKTAARFAAQQIFDKPINTETVLIAYRAADSTLTNDNEKIVRDAPGTARDFRINGDGSLSMTLERQAPTLLFKYIPKVKELTDITVTIRQNKLDM